MSTPSSPCPSSPGPFSRMLLKRKAPSAPIALGSDDEKAFSNERNEKDNKRQRKIDDDDDVIDITDDSEKAKEKMKEDKKGKDINSTQTKVHPFFSGKTKVSSSSSSSFPSFASSSSTITAASSSSFTGYKWETHDNTCLIYDSAENNAYGNETNNVIKIAGFDLDHTLIKPKSGGTFPRNADDWMLWNPEVFQKVKAAHAAGFKLVVFSNQAGYGKQIKEKDLKEKIVNLQQAFALPVSFYFAVAKDKHRKPMCGMWTAMEARMGPAAAKRIDKAQSFYVGDAAGRKQDNKRDGDRAFALNVGVPFHTPEQYFLGRDKEEAFSWSAPDPRQFLVWNQNVNNVGPCDEPAGVPAGSPEVVVLVGPPAAGKSTLAKRFVAQGYVHVNQDALKTVPKCLAALEAALVQGQSVVVDNQNHLKDKRKLFIDVAKQHNVPVRCLVIGPTDRALPVGISSVALLQHLNLVRYVLTDRKPVPDLVIHSFFKNLHMPERSEGFDSITHVPWRAAFTDAAHRRIFLMRLS